MSPMPADVRSVKKQVKSDSRSLSRRAKKERVESSNSDSLSHSPQRYSMSDSPRRSLSPGSSQRYSDRTRTRSRRTDSNEEESTPERAPSWMKDLIVSIKDSNNKIQVLEQNFAQEVQSLQTAISTSDHNVNLLNTRIQTIEMNSTTAITEAVATAVDIKLKSIDEAIAELKSTPTPRSLASSQRPGNTRPVSDAKQSNLERAHRVIIVGFPRKMMQASLKRAADMVIIAGSPQDRPRPTVRTYDMTRKIVLDFTDSTKASDFLNMLSTKGPIAFQDPIYP